MYEDNNTFEDIMERTLAKMRLPVQFSKLSLTWRYL